MFLQHDTFVKTILVHTHEGCLDLLDFAEELSKMLPYKLEEVMWWHNTSVFIVNDGEYEQVGVLQLHTERRHVWLSLDNQTWTFPVLSIYL